jgi:hypothetical protein
VGKGEAKSDRDLRAHGTKEQACFSFSNSTYSVCRKVNVIETRIHSLRVLVEWPDSQDSEGHTGVGQRNGQELGLQGSEGRQAEE